MSAEERPQAPYEALEAVIQRELAAVPSRDFATMAALKRERGAIVKRLPQTPPPAARPALERCLALQGRIAQELDIVRQAILRDLDHVRRAQRTAAGYAPARPPRQRVSASA